MKYLKIGCLNNQKKSKKQLKIAKKLGKSTKNQRKMRDELTHKIASKTLFLIIS
jgi:hypothetical protein